MRHKTGQVETITQLINHKDSGQQGSGGAYYNEQSLETLTKTEG